MFCCIKTNSETWLKLPNLYDNKLFFCFYFCVLNKNETKFQTKKKLAFGEDENTSALINIAQDDDSNIFELLQNLWINNLQFINFKCSRFSLLINFPIISLSLYTQMFLILQFSWLEKERKKQFKSQPPWLLKLSVFSSRPTPATITFWYFFELPLLFPPSIRDLRVC